MLRTLVLLLVLANAVYFAWSNELLRPYGIGPEQQSEPTRKRQQIHPERIRPIRPEQAAQPQAPSDRAVKASD